MPRFIQFDCGRFFSNPAQMQPMSGDAYLPRNATSFSTQKTQRRDTHLLACCFSREPLIKRSF